MKFQLQPMDKLEIWKSYQNKYFNNNPTPVANSNVSQIGSGDPNLQPTPEPRPVTSENNFSAMNYNEKITSNQKEIADIDAKLNNVVMKKDELKLIELNKISTRQNVVQTKTIQNSAYRELQLTEDGLISQKNQLQQEINIAKDKLQQGGLDSQAGEQFSAGIGLDPVMDQDRIMPDVPVAPAMSSSERAQYFDKEDTLLNPNFTMEDVAQGLTEQGASYLGGDNTILDKAMASPILDLQHGLSNPSEYELAKDYGYTNMDASAKEIKNNPAKFAGNVAGFVGAEVALTFGTLGVGKAVSKGLKVAKAIQQSKKAKPNNPIGVTDELPKVNWQNSEPKSLVLDENNLLMNNKNFRNKYWKEDQEIIKVSDNKIGLDDIVRNDPKYLSKYTDFNKNKGNLRFEREYNTPFIKRKISAELNNEADTLVKKDIENMNKELGLGNDKSITNDVINSKKIGKELDPYSSKVLNPSGTVDLQPLPKQKILKSDTIKEVEGESFEIEKRTISGFTKSIKQTELKDMYNLDDLIWNNYDDIIPAKKQSVASVKTGYKPQTPDYLQSLKSEKQSFEAFAKSTGIKQKPPNVKYTTEFGKTLTGVAGASAIGGATFAGFNNKKKSKNKKSNNIFNFKY